MSNLGPRPPRCRLAAAIVAGALTVGIGSGVASAAARTRPSGADHAVVPAKRKAPKVTPVGTYAVGKISETYIDQTRPTNANGGFPGAPNRTLLTAIYYPARGAPADKPLDNAPPDVKHGPYPLILFSHGVTARGVFYEDVLKVWASAGYVVVAPDYPLSNTNAPGGASFTAGVADVKNQPADASFVIDSVIKQDKSQKILGGTVDARDIGVAGHSLGAITTYGIAYSGCCADKRVKGAIPMSGFAGVVEPAEQYFRGKNPPLLALHGNADPIVPYGSDANTFADAKAPKFFLTFQGAGHISPFLGGTDTQAVILKKATIDFWDRYLKSDRRAIDRLQTDANVAGSTQFQSETGSRAAGSAGSGAPG